MGRAYVTVMLMVAVLACGCSAGRPLFNGQDLTGWVEVGSHGAWSVDNGVLKCNGHKEGYAWLSTEGKYRDFELTLESRIAPEANTGVFVRAPDRVGRISQTGLEVQLKDDRVDKDFSEVSGAVFSRIPAAGRFGKPLGEWNQLKITCVRRRLQIELNGQVASDTDMDTVKPKDSQWIMTHVPAEGYIGLQNHGSPAEFRNIRIRVLP